MEQEPLEEPLEAAGGAQRGAKVGDGLAIGHRIARGQAEKGAEAVAVGNLVGDRVVGQAMERLEHEDLEHEQRRKARPSARPLGRRGPHGRVEFGLELLPAHDFTHPQQRSFEGRHVEVLQELVEEPRFAKRKEVRHHSLCFFPPRQAIPFSAKFNRPPGFRECP